MLARLDAAFAAQRQFTADASHELRNPLAIIRTNVDVALADPADPEDLRHTIVVVNGPATAWPAWSTTSSPWPAARSRPWSTSRSTSAWPSPRPATTSWSRRRPAVFLDRAIAHGVVVMGDRDALKRAVPTSSTTPSASPRRVPHPPVHRQRGRPRLDRRRRRGSGISPEDQPHVFDRFWRADKARSRADGGGGLGLAIVRQIVESHGGQVRLQSKVGVGSSFVIWLPVTAASAVDGVLPPKGSGPLRSVPGPMPARTPTPAERARPAVVRAPGSRVPRPVLISREVAYRCFSAARLASSTTRLAMFDRRRRPNAHPRRPGAIALPDSETHTQPLPRDEAAPPTPTRDRPRRRDTGRRRGVRPRPPGAGARRRPAAPGASRRPPRPPRPGPRQGRPGPVVDPAAPERRRRRPRVPAEGPGDPGRPGPARVGPGWRRPPDRSRLGHPDS